MGPALVLSLALQLKTQTKPELLFLARYLYDPENAAEPTSASPSPSVKCFIL